MKESDRERESENRNGMSALQCATRREKKAERGVRGRETGDNEAGAEAVVWDWEPGDSGGDRLTGTLPPSRDLWVTALPS